MLAGWVALAAALLYLITLFAIAHFGDTRGGFLMRDRFRPPIYALTLAVYCTSWTFLGSVGLSSRAGLDFLPIYLGPLIGILLGLPLIARIIHIAKSQRITSVADFIGARYGKDGRVAAIVAVIAVVGTVPYIALQLKAISSALEIIVFRELGYVPTIRGISVIGDVSLLVTIVLAAFAIAFGTRHIDATEHQNGLMLAIAAESLVKLLAFLAVGVFVVFVMFDGFDDLFTRARQVPAAAEMLSTPPDPYVWVTTTMLAAFAIFLLPRQFHVMIVENRDVRDLRQAAWQFPAYLVAINVFVVPIALAGLVIFPERTIDRDFMVLSLPLQAEAGLVALAAFIGALSAATAMVIVESVACGIMVSNDLAMPFLLRRTNLRPKEIINDPAGAGRGNRLDMGQTVLMIRRVAVVIILFLGFAYYRASEQAALASIGLLSFAAIAQLVPAFFLGLFWQRANAQGALAALTAGFGLWLYLLFLPTLGGSGGFIAHIVRDGPFGLSFLAPSSILGTDFPPLVTGVALSLGINTAVLVLVSLLRAQSPIERLQASLFTRPEASAAGPSFKLWRSSVSVDDLRTTVARYLGEERTDRAFGAFELQRGTPFVTGQEADAHTIRFAEHLLASAIGAASSRLVLSLMLRRRNVSTEAALKLLDDASAAIQHSRTLLQHGLDHTRQGVTVFDRELRLMCWNRAFQDLFELPPDLVRFGVGLDEIVNDNARRELYGKALAADVIAQRIASLVQETEPQRLTLHPSGRTIEIRSNHLPDGGLVTTYTDITEAVEAERALAEANVTLEKRVRTRTDELTQANRELARAKLEAEEANASKTRFLAAASHDIIQPLNAARLYSSALSESLRDTPQAALAGNVEASLNAVEEILSALLEISRLDGGKLQPERSSFPIGDVLNQLQIEFGPVAAAKGLRLIFVPSSLVVTSDRRLLRRLLQNLVSNAIKYTITGRVLVGVKRRGGQAVLVVADTGIGIAANKQKVIFKEFQRLDQGARIERGLGLGLSIVERIVKVLGHRLELDSAPARGSSFRVAVPIAAQRPAHAASTPVEGETAAPPAPLAGIHVAVIDNEPAILDGMRTLLEGWGCTVTTGANAAAILTAVRSGTPPTLALVDYQLDEGNGLVAIRALRRRLRPGLPAALITADRSTEVRDQAAAAGVPVLNKPIKPSALRALIAQLSLEAPRAAE
ncbi:hybrid sensor histidine kinase/response regulator [Rhabdaerophilum calidifontis]|uniref:hybrid sensor histidine kinase/response regulator n=1 Tax=Rhabdaerophilum calidifontis TaxID=2604328 RepID=UPI00123B170C|nr:NahK/ErcS family hybrid sensor histidine kinase/response regulator [Rhabdaerophilum calidifontis]